MPIAVLDVGKTNAKVLLLDDAGQTLAQRARPCAVLPGPPYPAPRPGRVWAWAVDALAELARLARIDCIVPVAHGAAAVLLAGDELALPALDYEYPGPDATAAALAPELDPFAATGSPVLPIGLCLGAQFDWQERTFPAAFARTTHILPLAQYWAWRLSGVKATEVTSLGAHTHLWRPAEGRFSDLARRRGWAERFPPLRHAWETLGAVRPEVASATGLPADCRVLAGIHDSNASYLPHLVARTPPFTVLSTGTWIIAMSPGLPLARLDEHADMLANVDARGTPVPTARFMGGREVELVAGSAEALRTPADTGRRRGHRRRGGDGAAQLRGRQRPVHRPHRSDRGRCRARAGAPHGAGLALRGAHRRRDAGQARGQRPGAGRGQLPPQRRLLRPARRPAPGPADPRHGRSQRHRPRRLAAGPLGRPAELAQRPAGGPARMADPGPGPLPRALARAERRAASDGVAEDRGQRLAARDVVPTHAEHPPLGLDHPPGNLVDHRVAGGTGMVGERDHAGRVVDRARDRMIDVDEQRIDRAEGGRTCHVGDVRGGAALRLAGVEERGPGGDPLAMQSVEHAAGLLREVGIGERLGIAVERGLGKMRVAVHGAVDRRQRRGGGQHQRHLAAGQQRAQGLIDRAGELAQPHLLALGALDAAAGRAVVDRGLADRTGGIAGQARNMRRRGREVGRHLDQPHRVFRERQHVGGLRKA